MPPLIHDIIGDAAHFNPPRKPVHRRANEDPIQEEKMAVARVTKITASSTESFADALTSGVERACATLRGITGLHVVEQKCKIDDGKIAEYRITCEITFILED